MVWWEDLITLEPRYSVGHWLKPDWYISMRRIWQWGREMGISDDELTETHQGAKEIAGAKIRGWLAE